MSLEIFSSTPTTLLILLWFFYEYFLKVHFKVFLLAFFSHSFKSTIKKKKKDYFQENIIKTSVIPQQILSKMAKKGTHPLN